VCVFYVSLLANGITVVFIDPETGNDRANAIINHCESNYIFVDIAIQQEWNLTNQDSRIITQIQPVVTMGDLLQKLLRKEKKAMQLFPSCVESLPESNIAHEINPEADAYILFTSGTTSAPKGVRISYRALFSHLGTLSFVYQVDNYSKLFNHLILSHTDGMTQGPMLALFNSATVYRPFSFSIQRIEDIFDIVYSENITHWVMVPTMIGLIYQFKHKDSDNLNNNHFKYVISCGAKLENLLWQKFEEKFKTLIINGYGLTETVTGGLFAGPDAASHIIGTIGKPVDCEAKIMDENQQEKAIGEQGEIWLQGSLLMSGYLNAPEANREAFYEDWFKTGDIGYIGEDGCFRITGRKKLMIISGGINIFPEEVTEILHTHPAIRDAVTFGLEEDIWGEIVACAIVVQKQESLSEEEIVAYCRKHLEESKVPTRVFFMDELPYGRSGKVILNDIKKLADEHREPNYISPETKPAFLNIVSQCIQMPLDCINLNMVAEETAEWDSISHLLLIAAMENHFGIEFTPLEVMNVRVLSDLYSIIEKKDIYQEMNIKESNKGTPMSIWIGAFGIALLLMVVLYFFMNIRDKQIEIKNPIGNLYFEHYTNKQENRLDLYFLGSSLTQDALIAYFSFDSIIAKRNRRINYKTVVRIGARLQDFNNIIMEIKKLRPRCLFIESNLACISMDGSNNIFYFFIDYRTRLARFPEYLFGMGSNVFQLINNPVPKAYFVEKKTKIGF